MKIQKDTKYIQLQITAVALFVFITTYLANKIALQQNQIGVDTILLLIVNLAIVCTIYCFIVIQIEIVGETIVFKNIYGIVLKQIDKNEIKKVKLVYTDVNSKMYYFFSIFGN